jgi:hypothetical protein
VKNLNQVYGRAAGPAISATALAPTTHPWQHAAARRPLHSCGRTGSPLSIQQCHGAPPAVAPSPLFAAVDMAERHADLPQKVHHADGVSSPAPARLSAPLHRSHSDWQQQQANGRSSTTFQ